MPAQHKVRLLIDETGALQIESTQLSNDENDHKFSIGLARHPVSSSDPFLYHKTTNRNVYVKASESRTDCEDVLLWNERHEITESTIANIVVRQNGELFTPPIICGLLSGTFRQELIDAGKLKEKIIYVNELSKCEEIFLINSVRRWINTKLIEG